MMRRFRSGGHAGPPLRWLRMVATGIAVAAVFDPAVTISDHLRPEVAVTTDARLPDPSLGARVSAAMDGRFTVIAGPTIGAAAVVHIGSSLPDPISRELSPAFVIAPEPRAPWVVIEAIDAPARAHVHSKAPVTVHVRARTARGRSLTVTLEAEGVVVDRATREIASDDEVQVVPLAFAGAMTAGTVPLVVRAAVTGEARLAQTGEAGLAPTGAARADVGIEIRDRRWPVLAFDRRPSWMSTFVRRALESDPRFVVTSRVMTSRGASVESGRPPPALTTLPSLALFDAVIAGAPEELTDDDVSGLELFMRQQGGAVVLLPDEPADGRPYQRLLGHGPWRLVERAKVSGEPAATAFFSPNPDQPGSIWRTAVGPGRLIVSTALDAWRYRDTQSGAFDRFWRLAIAEAADATPAPLEIVPDRLVLAPGDATSARILAGPLTPTERLRILPSVRTGPERIRINRDGVHAETTIIVVPGAMHPVPDQRALLETWAASHSGRLLPESRLAELVPALERALAPSSRLVRWHPMRSAWWIVPFALALGAEWWVRRRRGLR